MDILESALAREIAAISTNSVTEVTYFWHAEIHANGLNIPSVKVLSIDILRNYESSFTDETIVTLILPAGRYAYRVYPYLKNLEVTMYREPLGESDGQPDDTRTIESERYVATLIDPVAINVAANSSNELDETALDLTNFLTLKFQLINKAVDQVRMKTVGGIYRRCKVEDVVRSILTMYSPKIEIQDNDIPIGVEMIEAHNQKVNEHIVIPHGVRLVDAPEYIHKHCSGIYTTGLAYYYQANHWYVFPPYDSSKFEQSDKTLTIIRLPANRMPGVERTFRKNGNNLVVLATGNAQVKNESESLLLTDGNGVRFADADQFMTNIVRKSGNKAVISRGDVNNEFISTERPNGSNLVLSSNKRITSNPWVEYSRLAARDGSLIGLVWENSDPALITPGMPVKILYLEDEEIKQVYGLVINVHHYTSLRGEGITASRHHTVSAITVFAKREYT
jgi:hypothetical protein